MISSLIIENTQAPFPKPWGNYLLEKIIESSIPESISWLPQTLGWKFVGAFLLILIGKNSYQAYKTYQRNAYRRDALVWLKQCQQAQNIKLYQQLPTLLRKTALHAFNRSDISQLSGHDWEHWLDEHCQHTQFTNLCPNLLQQLAYQPVNIENFKTQQYLVLIEQITLWITYHRSQNV